MKFQGTAKKSSDATFAFCTRGAAFVSFVACCLSASGCALWKSDEPDSFLPCNVASLERDDASESCRATSATNYFDASSSTFDSLDASFRGQVAENVESVSSGFPTPDDSFPTFDASFSSFDDATPPPETSELPDFISTGSNVSEPSANPSERSLSSGGSSVDEDFRPLPKRESLAEREKAEEQIEENFATWVKQLKGKTKSNGKTPRYLQPIGDNKLPDGTDLYSRAPLEEDEDKTVVRTVTLAGLEMLMENEESKRDLYDWEKEEPTPIDWSKYGVSWDNIRAWFGMGPDERAALEYMRQACHKQQEYSKTKDKKTLKEAARLYEKAAHRWPGPALRPNEAKKNPFGVKSGTLIEEDGLFFAAECWFFCRDFNRALVDYKALVSTYSSTIYRETAMKRLYYIGCYWVECSEKASYPSVNVTDKDKPTFSTFKGAEKAFSTIFLNDASDSGLAPDALFALANAYMRRGVQQGDGSFDSAARYYRQLYEFYPGSKRAEDACRLAMIALHRSYQGAFYDDGPLKEARGLAETILKSGRGNMDVVYEELENIKEEQAKRLYVIGAYYQKRGNFASARSYYNRLVREHPNTTYAVKGAQAYRGIENKPAEADQFAWVRPVAPFLPTSNNEYFEEAPDADMDKIATRDASLDAIGKDGEKDSLGFAFEDAETEPSQVADARKESKRR